MFTVRGDGFGGDSANGLREVCRRVLCAVRLASDAWLRGTGADCAGRGVAGAGFGKYADPEIGVPGWLGRDVEVPVGVAGGRAGDVGRRMDAGNS